MSAAGFASKGDCLLANGTSWRQAPSKPEYGGWTYGIACRSVEVADAPVEKEEEEGVGGEEPVNPVVARPAKAAVAAAEPAAEEPAPISPLRKPSSAKAAAPAAVEAGAADPNAPEVVVPVVAPKKPAAVPAAPVVAQPASKAPVVPAAAAAATEPKAKEKAPAAAKPAAAAAAPAPKAPAAPAAAPVGPAGPGSLSAPIRGSLSGRGASVAELQPGIESAAECASICATAEKNLPASCTGYSWCGAAEGCPGNVATGVCQLWSGRAGAGKLSADDSGWVTAARAAPEKVVQPPMKTQTAAAGGA